MFCLTGTASIVARVVGTVSQEKSRRGWPNREGWELCLSPRCTLEVVSCCASFPTCRSRPAIPSSAPRMCRLIATVPVRPREVDKRQQFTQTKASRCITPTALHTAHGYQDINCDERTEPQLDGVVNCHLACLLNLPGLTGFVRSSCIFGGVRVSTQPPVTNAQSVQSNNT